MQEIECKSLGSHDVPSKDSIPAFRAVCTRSTDTTNGILAASPSMQIHVLQIRASLPNEPSSLARLNVGTAVKDRGRPIHPPPPSLSSQKSRVESTHIGQHLVYLFHLLIYLPSKVGQKFPQELLVVSALLHGLVPVDYTIGGHDCSLVLCVVVSIGDVVSALLPYYESHLFDFLTDCR